MGFGVVFPAGRRELEPFACIRDWVGRGNATRPNAGRAASTGRFGLAEPGPSRKSSPGEATPPAESVMLHFPSAPGPAPHPPSGSRGCESWARAPGGRGGNTSPPSSPTTFRAALPLSHPPRPSPKPETNRSRAPENNSATLPMLTVLHGHSRGRDPKAGAPRHPKKMQKPRMEAALPQGRCQHSRDRKVSHWCHNPG